jgi:hypothetical protein
MFEATRNLASYACHYCTVNRLDPSHVGAPAHWLALTDRGYVDVCEAHLLSEARLVVVTS